MNILGISAFYHESSCCLLRDGRLVAAASEERFTRIKHDPRLPVEAFRFCLEREGLDLLDLDAIAYYELPDLKLERQLGSGLQASALDPGAPERAIRERLGWEGEILFFPHHLCHAASTFYWSGFPRAATFTVDGVGEWATTTYGRGDSQDLSLFAEVRFPHSLGLLYSTVTAYLGFAVNDGEYKVMGLAPYGEPRLVDRLRRAIRVEPGPGFTLEMEYFDFVAGTRMWTPAFEELLGGPPRRREEEILPFHRDLARSVQLLLEEILLEKVRWLHDQTGEDDLCMAGGVALNCVANSRIQREGPFRRLFVQPAAGDSGGCLGAAALAHYKLAGTPPPREALRRVDLGPSFSHEEIPAMVSAAGLAATDYSGREPELLEAVAERLERYQIVGWFHGRMEHGPRALGNRSILANPLDPEVRERLNRRVKKREAFRPFAPSVLAERADEHFELDHPSPFMLETCRVRSKLELPGITHVDGSARPQTVDRQDHPRFAALLDAFARRTGCPILVNTSFNVAGEPIVATPVDALISAADAELDALVLEDFLIDGGDLPAVWRTLLPAWRERRRSGFAAASSSPTSAISEELYTFV
ncbi:MAG TPA: carbamoyltransferase N-terminal domain-containing protein [Thermoanaerobaculia bacterium]|jgi:carbamoyltransferase|nr:carbamoyltransferase N-terminal domain-containing protein [Thermoanaerobaculia bacterium]